METTIQTTVGDLLCCGGAIVALILGSLALGVARLGVEMGDTSPAVGCASVIGQAMFGLAILIALLLVVV